MITVVAAQTGIYKFHPAVGDGDGEAIGYYREVNPDTLAFDKFIEFSSVTGNLIITKFDTINKLVSGTFEFEAEGLSPSMNRQITEGIFENMVYVQ